MTSSFNDLPDQAIVLRDVDAPTIGLDRHEAMNFTVSLSEVRDTDDLSRVLGAALLFPYEALDLDVLLDLMSDLDWFGHEAGYVLEFVGVDELRKRQPDVLRSLVALLPNLCDRWRSGGIPFRIVLHCDAGTKREVREAIERVNARIRDAARRPWLADLAPAEVIEWVE